MMNVSRKRFPPAPVATAQVTLARASIALISVVVVAAIGYAWIEQWSLGQSFFFTFVTLTTIGYSDYDLSEAGKAFTMFVMIGGLAVVTYSAGKILPSLFSHQLAWERKMENRIQKLTDHFIVCGLGRIGRAVCQRLAREGVPFVAIDPKQEQVAAVIETGYLALVGDATNDELLDEAGISRARGVACVTDSDTENIVITLSARAKSERLMIISRADKEETVRKIQRAGATRVISPIRSGGISIANAILKPNLAEFLERTHDRTTDLELAEILIQPESNLVGATIGEKGAKHERIALVALKREGDEPRPRPKTDERLAAGDVLIVAGDLLAIDALHRDASERSRAA